MPKSKVRKRRNGVTAVRRTDRRAGLVQQRAMGVLVDDFEDVLAAVPVEYDRGDFGAIVAHHNAATAVVEFVRKNRITDLIAALAGGDLVVIPGEDTAVDVQADGAAEVEVIQGTGGWTDQQLSDLTDLEAAGKVTADAPSPGFLAAVADAVPTTGQPWPYPWVWMTTRRRGLDYHEGAPEPLEPGDGPWPTRTLCSRSTVSPTSVWVNREDIDPSNRRCPRCADTLAQAEAPFNEVRPIDVREPGAALEFQAGRAYTITMPPPAEPIPTEILERIADGLRRGTPTPEADNSQVPLSPLTTVTAACTACGRVVRVRKNGGLYAHTDRHNGARCYG